MSVYFSNIENDVLLNEDYRRVVYTLSSKSDSCISVQVVLMNIKKGEDIHLETHPHTTQILQVYEGLGIAEIGKSIENLSASAKHRLRRQREVKNIALGKNTMLIIPPNTSHRIENVGDSSLKLCSIYVPPEHPQNTIQKHRPSDKT